MKKTVLSLGFLLVVLSSCIIKIEEKSDFVVEEIQKRALFEFFTEMDFSAPQYDDHFVKISFGAVKTTLNPYSEEKLFEFTSEWIAFKDIPKYQNRMLFDKDFGKINPDTHSIQIGYTQWVKIGETLQMKAFSEHFDNRQIFKNLRLNFK